MYIVLQGNKPLDHSIFGWQSSSGISSLIMYVNDIWVLGSNVLVLRLRKPNRVDIFTVKLGVNESFWALRFQG